MLVRFTSKLGGNNAPRTSSRSSSQNAQTRRAAPHEHDRLQTARPAARTRMSTEMLLSSHATMVFTCSSSSSRMFTKTSYRLLRKRKRHH